MQELFSIPAEHGYITDGHGECCNCLEVGGCFGEGWVGTRAWYLGSALGCGTRLVLRFSAKV